MLKEHIKKIPYKEKWPWTWPLLTTSSNNKGNDVTNQLTDWLNGENNRAARAAANHRNIAKMLISLPQSLLLLYKLLSIYHKEAITGHIYQGNIIMG